MEFRRAAVDRMVSACGRYSVLRVMYDGAPAYTAFLHPGGKETAQPIGSARSADKAKQAAIDHEQRQQQPLPPETNATQDLFA